jgi:hypothetical protein
VPLAPRVLEGVVRPRTATDSDPADSFTVGRGFETHLRLHSYTGRGRSGRRLPRVPSDGLLIGIAQIAVVIAGFTAVTSALTPPGGSWSPDHRIRQRAIVSTSFNVMFESLLPVIAFAWLGDARAAIVFSSVVVALYATWVVAARARQFLKTDAIRTRSGQLLFLLGPLACLLFAANAIAFASIAVYAVALCVQLAVAVISFYTVVATASS